jgi:hypothetical protein
MVLANLLISFHFSSFLRLSSIHHLKIQQRRFARRPASGHFLPLGELVQAGLNNSGCREREACHGMKGGLEQ